MSFKDEGEILNSESNNLVPIKSKECPGGALTLYLVAGNVFVCDGCL